MIYFDTTYLVRCYLEDPGFEQVRAFAEANDVACVRFGQIEAVAAFHRKHREGALTAEQFTAVLNQFEADLSDEVFSWLMDSDALFTMVRQAFRVLPPSVFVRSADALHLTCARENGFREIYSNDGHLLAAAAFWSDWGEHYRMIGSGFAGTLISFFCNSLASSQPWRLPMLRRTTSAIAPTARRLTLGAKQGMK